MCWPLREVGSPVPLLRFRHIVVKLSRREIQAIPDNHRRAQIEWKRQPIDLHCIMYGRNRVEVGADVSHVFARHPRVVRKRHRGIEPRAVSADAPPHRRVEFIVGPAADARLAVRGDVGRCQHAERRLDRPSAAEWMFAARNGMTAPAVGGIGEIPAAFDRGKILKIRAGARAGAGAECDQNDRYGWPLTH